MRGRPPLSPLQLQLQQQAAKREKAELDAKENLGPVSRAIYDRLIKNGNELELHFEKLPGVRLYQDAALLARSPHASPLKAMNDNLDNLLIQYLKRNPPSKAKKQEQAAALIEEVKAYNIIHFFLNGIKSKAVLSPSEQSIINELHKPHYDYKVIIPLIEAFKKEVAAQITTPASPLATTVEQRAPTSPESSLLDLPSTRPASQPLAWWRWGRKTSGGLTGLGWMGMMVGAAIIIAAVTNPVGWIMGGISLLIFAPAARNVYLNYREDRNSPNFIENRRLADEKEREQKTSAPQLHGSPTPVSTHAATLHIETKSPSNSPSRSTTSSLLASGFSSASSETQTPTSEVKVSSAERAEDPDFYKGLLKKVSNQAIKDLQAFLQAFEAKCTDPFDLDQLKILIKNLCFWDTTADNSPHPIDHRRRVSYISALNILEYFEDKTPGGDKESFATLKNNFKLLIILSEAHLLFPEDTQLKKDFFTALTNKQYEKASEILSRMNDNIDNEAIGISKAKLIEDLASLELTSPTLSFAPPAVAISYDLPSPRK